jgi:hypothetical protein
LWLILVSELKRQVREKKEVLENVKSYFVPILKADLKKALFLSDNKEKYKYSFRLYQKLSSELKFSSYFSKYY